MDEKYWECSKTLTQMCSMYIDLFGFVQKNENTLGSSPSDMLHCSVCVSEHYSIPWDVRTLYKCYEFYDQSHDSMFYLSWMDLYGVSFPRTLNVDFWNTFITNAQIPACYGDDFDDRAGGDLAACRLFLAVPGVAAAAVVPDNLITVQVMARSLQGCFL
jgi:hypothetical protein